MKRTLSVLAVLAFAGIANAQNVVSTGRPDANPPFNPTGPDVFNYQYDDGTVEDAIGITNATAGYDIIWLNRFATNPAGPIIQTVQAAIGSAGGNQNLNGRPMSVLIYSDPDGGSPNNATLLSRLDTTVANANTGVLNAYNVPDTFIPTANFFVAVLMKNLPPSGAAGNPNNTFPAAIDTTAPHTTTVSWAGFTAPANTMNENNLGTIPAGGLGAIEGFGINGNWALRAIGDIPEPSCLGLLTVAGVFGLRRRSR